ncbi:hypothetical protein [Terrabacter terrigena]|uniref:Uncharacterized protein n=1 Tax=Terrabacter terrigena TaxID=574718 RepID=A0ABW3MSY5_9MICO
MSVTCPLGAEAEAVTNEFVAFLDRLDRHPLETGYYDCADGIVDDYLARRLAPEDGFVCES